MGKGFIIALSTLSIAAAPASAGTASSQEQAKASAPAAAADAGKAKKYCVKDVITGTRMKSRACRTKAEWARDGVDLDAATKK